MYRLYEALGNKFCLIVMHWSMVRKKYKITSHAWQKFPNNGCQPIPFSSLFYTTSSPCHLIYIHPLTPFTPPFIFILDITTRCISSSADSRRKGLASYPQAIVPTTRILWQGLYQEVARSKCLKRCSTARVLKSVIRTKVKEKMPMLRKC